MEENKTKNLNMKFTTEDWIVFDELCAMYRMDKTNMVRQLIRHARETKPKFVLSARDGKDKK